MATLLQPEMLPDPLCRDRPQARVANDPPRMSSWPIYSVLGRTRRRPGPPPGLHGGNVTLGESEQRHGLGLLPGFDLELASSFHVRRG
jgi:hypothetical protein